MDFTHPSEGAAIAGHVAHWGARTSRCNNPWALIGETIEGMLAPDGVAWADFALVEGDGVVYLLLAHERMRPAEDAWSREKAGAVTCRMFDGAVFVDRTQVQAGPPEWGDGMAHGDVVRVRYAAATRMVSVVWRGRPFDIVALPAKVNIARTRFGVGLTTGNVMSVTGASNRAGRVCMWRAVVSTPCCVNCVFRV